MTGRILIIGAAGQIGTELTETLRGIYGTENVIASDIRDVPALSEAGPFLNLDVLDRDRVFEVIRDNKIDTVYLLAALLSASGEKKPKFAWKLNMDGLLNVLDAAVELNLDKVFWPSSIAVFGPNTPRVNTPQDCIMDPNTVYGISKLAGERWCEYYAQRYDVDVRSLRYPGIIGYKSLPGGGTTDYAVEIFHEALKKGSYSCFLQEDTRLPMMYMSDAVRATIQLMESPKEQITVRSAYNLGAIDFTPAELTSAIQVHMPEFTCAYEPDFRQAIADSWPQSIDDSRARNDWNWQPEFDLPGMTADMLENIPKLFDIETV